MDVIVREVKRVYVTLIVDPSISYDTDRKVFCINCGHLMFATNRHFAIVSDGLKAFKGSEPEVPLSVFRVTKKCGVCDTWYLIYFDGA